MLDYLFLAHQLNISGLLRGQEIRASCPFHEDSHPSFSLNTSNGLWICHTGCGYGDFYLLVERVLGCGPMEAREWIQNNGFGQSLESLIPEFQNLISPKEVSLCPDSEEWLKYFQGLHNDTMPEWFLSRGFSWETINHWNIRYDPIQDSVTIPIYYEKQLVGTVTRNTQKQPKYENSHNLPRNNILWGEISRSKNDIIICEGALDNLWLWQNEYNSIGLLGTYISQKQIELLRKLSFGEIILALDNDEAGKHGTEEAIKILVRNGWILPQIKQLKFPTGIKDPQDCSPQLLSELFKNRKSVVEIYLS